MLYVKQNVCGKKTSICLLASDIEVENIKFRNNQCIRFRNLSKHDEKIVLNSDEFFTMINVTPAVNRYMQQLSFSTPIIKDYLVDSFEQPNAPLIYGPIDTSIYNRLPQEVKLYRSQNKNQNLNNGTEFVDDSTADNIQVLPLQTENECSENEDNNIVEKN